MKNLMKIGILLALVAGVSSCEKIKGLFDVDFDTTLSGELDIEIPESGLKSAEFYEFTSVATIEPLDDEDIAEYYDNIEEINVNAILATVVGVNKNDVVFKKDTYFQILDKADTATFTVQEDWPIMQGTSLTLGELGSDNYKTVELILNKKKQFQIKAKGECTQKGVEITIDLGIRTTVIANPL